MEILRCRDCKYLQRTKSRIDVDINICILDKTSKKSIFIPQPCIYCDKEYNLTKKAKLKLLEANL